MAWLTGLSLSLWKVEYGCIQVVGWSLLCSGKIQTSNKRCSEATMAVLGLNFLWFDLFLFNLPLLKNEDTYSERRMVHAVLEPCDFLTMSRPPSPSDQSNRESNPSDQYCGVVKGSASLEQLVANSLSAYLPFYLNFDFLGYIAQSKGWVSQAIAKNFSFDRHPQSWSLLTPVQINVFLCSSAVT